ncbi:MAG: hypothetical protein JWN29_1426, partial [Acidimicrobiales bacterium]|nr:hypothetical protein [Acidimicrobiales bacterium]
MARSFRAVLAALLVVFALPLAALITTATAAQATTACPAGMAPSNGFPCAATGFTTKLVGVSPAANCGWGGAYGSVAFAPNGDPIVVGPESTGCSQRFDHTQTTGAYGTYPPTPGYHAEV